MRRGAALDAGFVVAAFYRSAEPDKAASRRCSPGAHWPRAESPLSTRTTAGDAQSEPATAVRAMSQHVVGNNAADAAQSILVGAEKIRGMMSGSTSRPSL
jgi:hypothetical protein